MAGFVAQEVRQTGELILSASLIECQTKNESTSKSHSAPRDNPRPERTIGVRYFPRLINFFDLLHQINRGFQALALCLFHEVRLMKVMQSLAGNPQSRHCYAIAFLNRHDLTCPALCVCARGRQGHDWQ
jgi:hypothetical protein